MRRRGVPGRKVVRLQDERLSFKVVLDGARGGDVLCLFRLGASASMATCVGPVEHVPGERALVFTPSPSGGLGLDLVVDRPDLPREVLDPLDEARWVLSQVLRLCPKVQVVKQAEWYRSPGIAVLRRAGSEQSMPQVKASQLQDRFSVVAHAVADMPVGVQGTTVFSRFLKERVAPMRSECQQVKQYLMRVSANRAEIAAGEWAKVHLG